MSDDDSPTRGAPSDEGGGAAAVHDIPATRLAEMRKAIHAHLQESNVFGQIRGIIDDYAADHAEFNTRSPDDVLRVLQERGVVQQILSRMQFAAPGAAGRGAAAALRSRSLLQGLKPGERYLHIRVTGGRAFIENLDATAQQQRTSQMFVCLHYGTQRFRSSPQEATVDPAFDDDFLVALEHGRSGADGLADLATPLQIAVVKEDAAFGRAVLVGENQLEWRKVLVSGFLSLTVELCGQNPSVPAGIVELELELIPGAAKVPAQDIEERIQAQRTAIVSADREFLIYARRWWAEYHAVRAAHRQRQLKVFAATANGRIVPVTHFVSVIGPDRGIDSPTAAARFVSLLALRARDGECAELLAGAAGASDVWPSTFVFLSQRHGDVHSHATLLCSLLLGFGLDAYCVVGTEGASARPYMWVMTRRRLGPADYDITFWDAPRGERYAQNGGHHYVAVGCVFNHMNFYGNTQEDDGAVVTSFALENEVQWAPLNPLKLRMVPKFPNAPLLHIGMDTRAMETDLEASLRRLIGEHRTTLGLQTSWDDALAAVTAQALVQYEGQRSTGAPADLALFHACVKGTIGEGRTFKGYPMNVQHVGEARLMGLLLGAPAGREIVQLVADDAKLAIRVRIFAFPESVVSVWLMLSARYRPLQSS